MISPIQRSLFPEDEPAILPFRREPESDSDDVWPLEQYYFAEVLPRIDIKPSSLRGVRTALRHWVACTPNRDIRDVTSEDIRLLRDGLTSNVSPATVNKTWRTLAAIFNGARQLGFIDVVPQLGLRHRTRLVKEPKYRQRKTITHDECNLLLRERCRYATWPAKRLPAARIWRRIVMVLWVTAARIETVLNLTWDELDEDECTIEFLAMKTSKLRRLPIPKQLLHQLVALRGRTRSTLMFPGFQTVGCYLAAERQWKNGWRTTWRRDICGKTTPDDQGCFSPSISPKNFRQTAIRRYNRIEPGLGAWVAQHAQSGVTAINYDDPTDEIFRIMQTQELPAAFYDAD